VVFYSFPLGAVRSGDFGGRERGFAPRNQLARIVRGQLLARELLLRRFLFRATRALAAPANPARGHAG